MYQKKIRKEEQVKVCTKCEVVVHQDPYNPNQDMCDCGVEVKENWVDGVQNTTVYYNQRTLYDRLRAGIIRDSKIRPLGPGNQMVMIGTILDTLERFRKELDIED